MIVFQYPTVSDLIQAYENCLSKSSAEQLLSNLKDGKKSVTSAIGINLAKLYTEKTLK